MIKTQYSGAFLSGNAQVQPMPSNPPPAKRHGEMKRPDDNWSTPPASVGAGYMFAEKVEPQMTASGIMDDFGHQWGHEGTAKTRNARRARFVDKLLGRDTDAQTVIQTRAQNASALGHGDKTSQYFPSQVYDPRSHAFAGESYVVDFGAGEAGDAVALSGRVITKTNGGEHMDGPRDAMYKAVGFRRGIDRRYAIARYSSPTIGAMYSKNTLRGVLPNTVAVPTNQPASTPWNPSVSGIASQQRYKLPAFTTPALFRTPPSESDTMIAARDSAIGAVIGIGF